MVMMMLMLMMGMMSMMMMMMMPFAIVRGVVGTNHIDDRLH
jgi:hypothetical protein